MTLKSTPWWVVAVWLAIWQVLSLAVGYTILLPSPWVTLTTLCTMVGEAVFWQSITATLWHITLGFFSALVLGITCAALAHKWRWVHQLLTPLLVGCKSVPVVSFTILILIWWSSKHLAVIIALIMVLPIVYTQVATALGTLDGDLQEMAQVFSLSPGAYVRYVVLPQILPYVRSACLVGLGVCFKAGIAAEVIGLASRSIGEQLYQAKLYLDTPRVFAWTLAIVALSYGYEHLLGWGIDRLGKKLEQGRWHQ